MWFHLPVDSGPPPLVSPTVGFERLVAHGTGERRTRVSVLDSPLARLLRAGITVAHRLRGDEPGHWYVAAPGWPGLPDEAVYPIDASGDLPGDIRRKLQLFLRTHELAPFATIEHDRREFTLRGAAEDLIDIVEDRFSIFRGGELVNRVREIKMTPLVTLTAQQRAFLTAAMTAAEAVQLDEEPTLACRIGPPATGPTPYRQPLPVKRDMTLEEFVAERFLGHLNRLMAAELTGSGRCSELAAIRVTLRGLSSVLEPTWRTECEARLDRAGSEVDRHSVLPKLMASLVSAVRAPKLGDLARRPVGEVLYSRLEQQLLILFDRCRGLAVNGPEESWSAALRSAEQLDATTQVLEPLWPKGFGRLRKEHLGLLDALRSSLRPPEDIELVGLSVAEAFQLGRDMEHAQWTVTSARYEFVGEWPGHVESGRKQLGKIRKKLL